MRLFSEATLLKMENTWTQHRKDWEASPSFLLTWFDPTLLLKPNEIYPRKSYLRAAIIATVFTTIICILTFVGVLLTFALILHLTWADIINPKIRVQLIAILSKGGINQLPLMPFIMFGFSLAINWPRYFFWNRRAKRLQQEGYVEVPTVAAAVTDDVTVWPPAPRPMK